MSSGRPGPCLSRILVAFLVTTVISLMPAAVFARSSLVEGFSSPPTGSTPTYAIAGCDRAIIQSSRGKKSSGRGKEVPARVLH
jgi:hypothetical protein